MNLRKSLLTGILASSLTLGGAAFAQDSTPVETPAASPPVSPATHASIERFPLTTAEGTVVAYAEITQNSTAGDVTFIIESSEDSNLEPGMHGIHVHEAGVCDPEGETPFESAGGHFNPTDHTHGAPDEEEAHAGDLGNIEVAEDGSFNVEITTDKMTLIETQENAITGPNGSALIIHAGEDDLETDPSGESGDRLACGVITEPYDQEDAVGTPLPDMTPVGTPIG